MYKEDLLLFSMPLPIFSLHHFILRLHQVDSLDKVRIPLLSLFNGCLLVHIFKNQTSEIIHLVFILTGFIY